MYCINCRAVLAENAKLCAVCGTVFNGADDSGTSGGCVGYSEKINDPCFARYIKNNNRWSVIFSVILAVAAIIGFFIYGETSSQMENPQALYIGFGIGSMFLIIALFQILSRKRSKTWDGVVVDKIVKKKSRRKSSVGGDNDYTHYYTEFEVIVQADNGRMHRMIAEDDDTVFNYYQIGDRVRHHAGVNSYEKFDKSKDSIIFCNACGTLCNINDDVCFRCRCPLLK